MTTPASIEKPAGQVEITIEARAYHLADCAEGSPDWEWMREQALIQLRAVHDEALDKIVQAGCRSASLGARHIAELAQSMKHKEVKP